MGNTDVETQFKVQLTEIVIILKELGIKKGKRNKKKEKKEEKEKERYRCKQDHFF